MTTETDHQNPAAMFWPLFIITVGFILSQIGFFEGDLSMAQHLLGLTLLILSLGSLGGDNRALHKTRGLMVTYTLIWITALLLNLFITFPQGLIMAVDGIMLFLRLWFLFALCQGLSELAHHLESHGTGRWLKRCAYLLPWGFGGWAVMFMLPLSNWTQNMVLVGVISMPFGAPAVVGLFAFFISMMKLMAVMIGAETDEAEVNKG